MLQNLAILIFGPDVRSGTVWPVLRESVQIGPVRALYLNGLTIGLTVLLLVGLGLFLRLTTVGLQMRAAADPGQVLRGLGEPLRAEHRHRRTATGRKPATVLHERLIAAPRGAAGHDGLARSHITTAYVTALREQITALEAQISEQLDLHPDKLIFTSLPNAGRVRAARLLSEIGDCRARFPTADSLHCLAGAAPSTRQSGKVKIVSFRWGNSCAKRPLPMPGGGVCAGGRY